MITNLLNQDVIYEDVTSTRVTSGKEYKICAIYQYEDEVMLGIVDDAGKMIFGVAPAFVRINNNHSYTVFLYYSLNKKIMAIKAAREITGIDLKEAKDLVEAHPEGVRVKKNLTHSEAREVLNIIEANGLEGRIVKE
jgi:ribosomal protein L7/L12